MDSDDDRLVLEALRSGDPHRLEDAATLVEGFPDGEDSQTGRQWVLHAIVDAPLATLDWMLDYGVDLAVCDDAGYTPLIAAIEGARADRLEVLQRLIAAGAPLNGQGINGWTPLHMAAARDDVAALELLLEAGADVSIRTGVDGYATPLEEARHLGQLRAARCLEAWEARPADDSPLPGWRCAADAGHFPLIAEMLTNHGIRVEIVPAGSLRTHPAESLWVRAADHPRAVELLARMTAALETASAGPWRCSGCGEENDAAFDSCWQCGRDHTGG